MFRIFTATARKSYFIDQEKGSLKKEKKKKGGTHLYLSQRKKRRRVWGRKAPNPYGTENREFTSLGKGKKKGLKRRKRSPRIRRRTSYISIIK